MVDDFITFNITLILILFWEPFWKSLQEMQKEL